MTQTPAFADFKQDLRDARRRDASRRAALRPWPTDRGRLAIRLWLPLTPLFLLLGPLVLAGAAVGVALNAPFPKRRRGLRIAGAPIARPWRSAWALGGVLLSLSGTLIEVETPAALIRLRIL